MTGNELRQKFLRFFQGKDHLVLPSASLIPDNDPTLLLIGAGMAPFKPFFTGKMKPPHPRIATSQKCVRTGDIENVGRTARHHTFFEMLGNFSFGDYFKREAIAWAWEFVTEELKLPKEKLWVTIHTEDDEAQEIWEKEIGVPANRIVRMKDNFWEIGPGPCGPCSEIYIDLGPERGCGKEGCGVGCNCDRYLEIWNLVFTQYDRDEAGNYTPLAKKNIDTGAGLERIASVLQGVKTNFETDLLYPIIEYASRLAGVQYGREEKTDVSLKVIADHGRGATFMIGDGVLPSNEGRGYVLRRILRRAIRHGKLLGIDKPFLAGIADVVAKIFAEPYPELTEKREFIKRILELEEERFQATLEQGMHILQQFVADAKKGGASTLSGDEVFKLYDTYGFPLELTREIVEEQGLAIDEAGFARAMEEQRQRARAARQENARLSLPDLAGIVTEPTRFAPGAQSGRVVALVRGESVVEAVHDGEEAKVILDVTPFYAESGGQVGDQGLLSSQTGVAEVFTTQKMPDGTIYHEVKVTGGTIRRGDVLKTLINEESRQSAARNHTATHLLHRALKDVLGEHVNQAGSLVAPDRLRFDFSHFAALSRDETKRIETAVNEAIIANLPVTAIETSRETANEMGAIALFGEKYGEKVRVIKIGDYSTELCGGTHVKATGEIGLFKIVSEGGVGAGLRRIEAVTGRAALAFVEGLTETLEQAAATLKAPVDELPAKAEALLQRVKTLEKEVEKLSAQLAKGAVDELLARAVTVAGVKVVTGKVPAGDAEDLRAVADMVRDRLVSGVVVLGAVQGDKVNFVGMVTKDVLERGLHAGNIIREVAKAAGGGGGGRPEMAQAGGKDPAKLDEALAVAQEAIRRQLNAG